jgi:soluble lytic murein transglycosylase-like protein
MRRFFWISSFAVLTMACFGAAAHAAEYVTLRNGFNFVCDHQVTVGSKVRLYMDAAGTNFMEVSASDILSSEVVTLPKAAAEKPAAAAIASQTAKAAQPIKLSDAQIKPMLATAGATYDLDVDLLASVVRQESGGDSHAVSHAGAQGLMQLMPRTASDLGVSNTFAPKENIEGGTAYLDSLLKRYHDNLSLALAAYNAGPAAVDRWHGIPPYSETRAYVARVIHEYNRRYELRRQAELRSSSAQLHAH